MVLVYMKYVYTRFTIKFETFGETFVFIYTQ